jgi:hypothetical protein
MSESTNKNERTPRRRRFAVLTVLAALFAVLVGLSAPGSALADDAGGRWVTIPLTYEKPTGGVQPDVVGIGNCGIAYLFVYDDGLADGIGTFIYGYYSSHGTVVRHDISINWINDTLSTSGTFNDGGFPFSSRYATQRVVPTGAGYVDAVMVVRVVHLDTLPCYGQVPDSGEVS